MKIFTILGTGWLGLELAKSLQNQYKIKVSSRTEEKIGFYENLGFETYVLNEIQTNNLDKLLNCNYLFINFPPSKFDNYVEFLNTIYAHEKIKNIEKIFFISSTSIYPKEDGVYDENSVIDTPTSQKVFDAETAIKNKTNVIFRCSGLIGGDRIAGKRLSGKEVKDSNSLVNHIHRDDIISATNFVIQNNINGVFNLTASITPTKKEVYKNNSIKHNFEPSIFLDISKKNRIIDGSKITKLGFKYKYKNPLLFD